MGLLRSPYLWIGFATAVLFVIGMTLERFGLDQIEFLTILAFGALVALLVITRGWPGLIPAIAFALTIYFEPLGKDTRRLVVVAARVAFGYMDYRTRAKRKRQSLL